MARVLTKNIASWKHFWQASTLEVNGNIWGVGVGISGKLAVSTEDRVQKKKEEEEETPGKAESLSDDTALISKENSAAPQCQMQKDSD